MHKFWQVGDRESFVAAAQEATLTAWRECPTKQTAGRWYILMDELRDTEGGIRISRQRSSLWCTARLLSIYGPVWAGTSASFLRAK